MSKVVYKRREFLEPFTDSQTAYVYAYIEDYYREGKRKGKRDQFDRAAEFGLHDGNDTLHLHFDWSRQGRALQRDVRKLRVLAGVANELADKLEKLK